MLYIFPPEGVGERKKYGKELCPLQILDHIRRTTYGAEEMINIWGVCEFAEMTHDPLRRWDLCCSSFNPAEIKRVEDIKRCCANCIYWLIADERLESSNGQR